MRRFSFASGEAAKVRAAKAWAEAAEAPPQPSTDAAVTGRLVRRFSFASGEAAKVRAAKARAAAEAASSPKLDNGRKLFAAVKRGQLPMVREALACAECDVNCHDHERNTPLHWAVKLDDAQSLTLLLTHAGRGHDLDVNRANARGETALHLAAGGGQHRLVRELWRQPALKPELRDKDGHTAHRLAVRGSHSELAKLLAAGRWGAPANRWGEVGASRRKLKGAVGAVVALQKAGGWNSEREEAPEGAAVAAARARAAVAARAAAAAAAAASATPESAAAVASAASAAAQRAAAASAAMPPVAAAAAAAAAEAKAAAAAATAAAAAEAAAKAEAEAAAAHLERSAVLRLGVRLERGQHGGVEGLEVDFSISVSLVAVCPGRLVALAHHVLKLELGALVTQGLHEGLQVLRLDGTVAALVEERERLLELRHLLLRHLLRASGHHERRGHGQTLGQKDQTTFLGRQLWDGWFASGCVKEIKVQ